MKSGFLKSRNIRLSRLFDEDVKKIASWYEETEFIRLFDCNPPYPQKPEEVLQWITEKEKSSHNFLFAIRRIDTDLFIGYLSVEDVNWYHRTGRITIIIGNEDERNKGLGTEAMELILNFVYIKFFGKKARTDLRDGHIRPVTSEELTAKKTSFRVYSALYPVVWLISRLDKALFVLKGYGIMIWSQRRD